MMKLYSDKWEESYTRKENYTFYPKEETVKFLNRFIRKKTDPDKFIDIMDFSSEVGVKALEYGCGIGRGVILLKEFGVDAYGLDISSQAIRQAKQLAKSFDLSMDDRFSICEGDKICFEDNFFDFVICDSVLDSMHFELAKRVMKELDRVTKKILFINLISGDDHKHYKEYDQEEEVTEDHEKGTIQSYFNWDKILELISSTAFSVKRAEIITTESCISRYKYGRYHVILSKK